MRLVAVPARGLPWSDGCALVDVPGYSPIQSHASSLAKESGIAPSRKPSAKPPVGMHALWSGHWKPSTSVGCTSPR